MPCFYVLKKMIVGQFVDADSEQHAMDLVGREFSREFDVTEDTTVLSAINFEALELSVFTQTVLRAIKHAGGNDASLSY